LLELLPETGWKGEYVNGTLSTLVAASVAYKVPLRGQSLYGTETEERLSWREYYRSRRLTHAQQSMDWRTRHYGLIVYGSEPSLGAPGASWAFSLGVDTRGISQGEVSRIVNGELYARVPPSTKEQEQSARKKAINERVERAYAEAMARIPRVDDRPTRKTEAPPVYQPPGSSDSGGQQPGPGGPSRRVQRYALPRFATARGKLQASYMFNSQ
jgi:hypothetical protein